ncbi:cupin [Microbulbifer sp. NBRC 101763]|uniref:cupin n=1 Tax=Microbulbifer sp. NBRC 101763 TaxID=1113820 RepID=UPI003340469B
MEIVKRCQFVGEKAWQSKLIVNMNGITTKLNWMDKSYVGHVNDGQEVFAVMDGSVEMFYKREGKVCSGVLNARDIFYASEGAEYLVHPLGVARVLVIEHERGV